MGRIEQEREKWKVFVFYVLFVWFLFSWRERFDSVSRQNSNGHQQTQEEDHTHNSRNAVTHYLSLLLCQCCKSLHCISKATHIAHQICSCTFKIALKCNFSVPASNGVSPLLKIRSFPLEKYESSVFFY